MLSNLIRILILFLTRGHSSTLCVNVSCVQPADSFTCPIRYGENVVGCFANTPSLTFRLRNISLSGQAHFADSPSPPPCIFIKIDCYSNANYKINCTKNWHILSHVYLIDIKFVTVVQGSRGW